MILCGRLYNRAPMRRVIKTLYSSFFHFSENIAINNLKFRMKYSIGSTGRIHTILSLRLFMKYRERPFSLWCFWRRKFDDRRTEMIKLRRLYVNILARKIHSKKTPSRDLKIWKIVDCLNALEVRCTAAGRSKRTDRENNYFARRTGQEETPYQ